MTTDSQTAENTKLKIEVEMLKQVIEQKQNENLILNSQVNSQQKIIEMHVNENKSFLKIIELLSENKNTNNIEQNYNQTNDKETGWKLHTNRRSNNINKTKENFNNKQTNGFEHSNRFSPIQINDELPSRNTYSSEHVFQNSNGVDRNVPSVKKKIELQRRPLIRTSERYIQSENRAKPTIPGNRTYASTTKYGKKICIVGDSHVKRIKRKLFNENIQNGNAYVNCFSGATIKRLGHHILPTLHEDKPDIVLIHVGSNDITHSSEVDPKEVAKGIVDLALKCKLYGAKEVYSVIDTG